MPGLTCHGTLSPCRPGTGHRRTLTDTCCCLQVFLVFGKSGWIGGLIGGMLKERGLKFEYANARLEDRAGILADIERVKPTHILNAAGLTGRPNVDWCEDHKVSTGVTVSGLLERWRQAAHA